MKKTCLIFFLLLQGFLSLNVFAEQPVDALTEGMVNPGYHDKPQWFKESFLDIRDDIQEASSTGKRVLLYFYQDGCPYCGKLLRDNFGDVTIASYTRENFDVIAINMWGDREVVDVDGNTTSEKLFSRDLRVQFTPTLLFLDEKGKVILRINGYFEPHKFLTALTYIAEKKENTVAIRDYFKTVKPEQASGKLQTQHNTLTDLSDLSVRSDPAKPLIVMFEQPVCKACDELHQDILQRDQLRESLKSFDVAVFDAWSEQVIKTPSGQLLPVRQWANMLGIQYSPSLVFFDVNGKEVFRTEAYLKSFHTRAALDYVSSGAYLEIPEFQRYVQKIADDLHAQGIEFDLMD